MKFGFLRTLFGSEPVRTSTPVDEHEQQWRIEQKVLLKDQINEDRKLYRITVVSVILAGVAAVASLGSLYYIAKTVKATQDQATAAIDQAKAAKVQADAADIQADAAKVQADTAKASVKLAQQSFDASAKSFQMDQRAWVGPHEIPPVNFTSGPTRFFIVLVNSGKSPARNFQSLMAANFSTEKFTPIYKELGTSPSATMVYPGMRIEVPFEDIPFTKARIDAIKAGKLNFYLYGKFTYEDIFNVKREGTFCFYTLPTLIIAWCSTYNESK